MDALSQSVLRAFWLAASILFLLAPHAASVVILNIIPADSACQVSIQDLPNGITAELNPSTVNLIGQINLRDSANSPGETNTSATGLMTWQAATASSRPEEVTAVLSAGMGSIPLATITISQPVVEISGGEFQPASDGTFTFTPTRMVLRASSVTGTAFGSNVNEQNVTVPVPQNALPGVSGQLTRRLTRYRLSLQSLVSVPISSFLAGSGASASVVSAAGASRFTVQLNALAVGAAQ